MKPSTKMWLPTPTMQVGQSSGGKATGVSGGRDVLEVAASEVPLFGCYAANEGEGRRAGPPGLGCVATIRRRVCRIRARLFARRPATPAASMDWRSLSGDVVVQLFWQVMFDELQKREHHIVVGQHTLCDIIWLVDRGHPEGSNPWTSEAYMCWSSLWWLAGAGGSGVSVAIFYWCHQRWVDSAAGECGWTRFFEGRCGR